MSNSMKLSVVMELLADAFNKSAQSARQNYQQTSKTITDESQRIEESTAKVATSLSDIFKAKDAAGVAKALAATTKELNGAKDGARLTAEQLATVGRVGKNMAAELGASLKVAQAELKALSVAKASPTDIDNATKKVGELKAAAAEARTQLETISKARTTPPDIAEASRKLSEMEAAAQAAESELEALAKVRVTPLDIANATKQLDSVEKTAVQAERELSKLTRAKITPADAAAAAEKVAQLRTAAEQAEKELNDLSRAKVTPADTAQAAVRVNALRDAAAAAQSELESMAKAKTTPADLLEAANKVNSLRATATAARADLAAMATVRTTPADLDAAAAKATKLRDEATKAKTQLADIARTQVTPPDLVAAIEKVRQLEGAVESAGDELSRLSKVKAAPEDIAAARAKVEELKKSVADAQANYGRFQVAASQAMQRAGASTQDAADKAKAAGAAIYNALNIRTSGSLRAEIASLTRELESFQKNSGAPAAEAQRVTAAASARIGELKRELSGVKAPAQEAGFALSQIGGAVATFTGVAVGLASVKTGIESILGVTMRFESINKQLEYAFRTSERAGEEFNWVRGVANKLGLELENTARGYAKLAAATKDTNLEGEPTRVLFEGIASAAAALALSADDTNGVLLALSQIAAKGKVSMEELRGQLGERLGPAMAIAAKSIGVTVQEMDKLVEGGLDSVTFLKAFGPAMLEAFAGPGAKNIATLQGQVALLKNQLTDMLLALGKGGVGDGAVQVLNDLSDVLSRVSAGVSDLDPSTVVAVKAAFQELYGVVSTVFVTLGTAIADAVSALNSLAGLVTGVVASFAGMDDTAEQVDFVTRAIQGLGIALGFVTDGVKAIGITFTGITGIVESFFSAIVFGLSKVTFGDLSRDLENLSFVLQNRAQASFHNASQAALDFKSAGVAAADAIVNAQEGVAGAVTKSGAAMTAAAGSAAASTAKLGEEAGRAGAAIETGLGKGTEITLGVAKAGTEAADAFRALAQQVGVNLPPSLKSVDQLGIAMGVATTQTSKLTALVMKELPEAIAKLSGPDLVSFQDSFVNGMIKAGASVERLNEVTRIFATQAVRALGGDIAPAVKTVSAAFEDQQRIIQSLIGNQAALRQAGIDTGLALSSALDGMLAKASNRAELNVLIDTWKTLGKEGKVSGDAMVNGINAAKQKIDELTPGVNSLAEAFRKFGLQTREDAARLAKEYGEAFQVMKNSGKATAGELTTAFTAYAKAVVSANNGVVPAFIEAAAAALKLKVAVDETGEVAISSATKTVSAQANVAAAFDNSAAAADRLTTATQRAAEAAMVAAEQKIEQQKRADKLKQDQIDAEDKRLNRDSQGFSLDKTGKQTVVAFGATWLSILNELKAYGVQNEQAARSIADEFTNSKGQVDYMNNAGQRKYQGDTLSVAVQNAAIKWLRDPVNAVKEEAAASTAKAAKTVQPIVAKKAEATTVQAQQTASAKIEQQKTTAAQASSPSMSQDSASSTGSGKIYTIEFVGADGAKASMNTTPGTTPESFIAMLKKAGATSIVAK